MAKLTEDGRVLSDNGEWLWNPEGGSIGGGTWERIAPAAEKPGLAARLLVKKEAQGKPGFGETMQAAKLQKTRADRALGKIQENAERRAKQ